MARYGSRQPLTPEPPQPYHLPPDDLPPDSAGPVVFGTCDGCPATACAVLMRTEIVVPDGWTSHQAVTVQELSFCLHHADLWVERLVDDGWAVVARRTLAGAAFPRHLL